VSAHETQLDELRALDMQLQPFGISSAAQSKFKLKDIETIWTEVETMVQEKYVI